MVSSNNFKSTAKINSTAKILLVKTYGNTFFIEGELWLFRWKRLIARWKECTLSYTCVSLYGYKCSETSFVRCSNMSFDAIFLIFWRVWCTVIIVSSHFSIKQRHAYVAESTFFPTRYQTLSTKEFKISFDEKRVPICFY